MWESTKLVAPYGTSIFQATRMAFLRMCFRRDPIRLLPHFFTSIPSWNHSRKFTFLILYRTISNAVRNKGGSWVRFHAKLNHVVDNFYYRLGFWVARHTKATLAISLLFVIICSFGFMNFTIETDGESFGVVAPIPCKCCRCGIPILRSTFVKAPPAK